MERSWVTEKTLYHIARSYGDDFVLSCSFGSPEGMILIDMLSRHFDNFTVCTIDTGRLPQATYNLIDRAWKRYNFKLSMIFPEADLLQKMLAEKGTNSFYESEENRMECCNIRKVLPFKRYLKENKIRAVITGLRKEQSDSRQDIKLIELDKYDDCAKINPIYDWTRKEVMEYARHHGVPINELHHQGYESVGCKPCSRPGKGRAGRWWWEDDTIKECGLHIGGSGI